MRHDIRMIARRSSSSPRVPSSSPPPDLFQEFFLSITISIPSYYARYRRISRAEFSTKNFSISAFTSIVFLVHVQLTFHRLFFKQRSILRIFFISPSNSVIFVSNRLNSSGSSLTSTTRYRNFSFGSSISSFLIPLPRVSACKFYGLDRLNRVY